MGLIRRVRALFKPDQLADDLDTELQFHLAMREQLNRDQGMPPEEARFDARRRFGNSTLLKERTRDMDIVTFLETVVQDLRFAARMLAKHPAFTAVAVLALAVGIGVNTAVFTAYKAVLLQPLEAKDPGRLVNVYRTTPQIPYDPSFSYPDYEDYRDQNRVFSGLVASANDELALASDPDIASSGDASTGALIGAFGFQLPSVTAGGAQYVSALSVSENYFSVLGVNAIRGRVFLPQDAADLDAHPALLVSENYWQRRFGGKPSLTWQERKTKRHFIHRHRRHAARFYGDQQQRSQLLDSPAPSAAAASRCRFLARSGRTWLLSPRPARARRHHTRGAGRDDVDCGSSPIPARPTLGGRQALHDQPDAWIEPRPACQPCPRSWPRLRPLADHGRGRPGLVDCLRQCRKPAIGSFGGPPAGDGSSSVSGRQPRPHRPAVANGKCSARFDVRRRFPAHGLVGAATSNDRSRGKPTAGVGFPGPASGARRQRVRLCVLCLSCRRHFVWTRTGFGSITFQSLLRAQAGRSTGSLSGLEMPASAVFWWDCKLRCACSCWSAPAF